MQTSERPVGVLDSGVGGLTIARAIKDILPQETIYYIGDTANLPYGEKTTESLQTHVQKIIAHLLSQGCKAIVIACNTATVAAADRLKQEIPAHIPLLDVVTPVIDHITQQYPNQKIGLIGTQYTVDTNYYHHLLKARKANILLNSLATPLLVPMIEADQYDAAIVERYVLDPALQDISGLILGCTHYWLIKEQIQRYYPQHFELINGAKLLAQQLREVLSTNQWMNTTSMHHDRFMVTSLTMGFQKILRKLFGETATCEKVELP
jgi:glutamate racemase